MAMWNSVRDKNFDAIRGVSLELIGRGASLEI